MYFYLVFSMKLFEVFCFILKGAYSLFYWFVKSQSLSNTRFLAKLPFLTGNVKEAILSYLEPQFKKQ